mmetsp:Transcript_6367/g.23330  ORF Transcript_6367/g.23330 Transcript_6367/m.23330 type:complete len:212 (-) Transcript_6367:3607-4242(-)
MQNLREQLDAVHEPRPRAREQDVMHDVHPSILHRGNRPKARIRRQAIQLRERLMRRRRDARGENQNLGGVRQHLLPSQPDRGRAGLLKLVRAAGEGLHLRQPVPADGERSETLQGQNPRALLRARHRGGDRPEARAQRVHERDRDLFHARRRADLNDNVHDLGQTLRVHREHARAAAAAASSPSSSAPVAVVAAPVAVVVAVAVAQHARHG